MPKLKALNISVNADLVVFDKDGTLIDFHTLWGPRVERAIDATCASLGWNQSLTNKLTTALGYDPQTAQVVSQGPLATAPIRSIPWDMFTQLLPDLNHQGFRLPSQRAMIERRPRPLCVN